MNQNQGTNQKPFVWTVPFKSILMRCVQTWKQVCGWPKLSCEQFQQCPFLPVHYTPLATASTPIYLRLPARAGERTLSKPTGTTAAPTAQVQRLNNRKHVQYINISVDSNLRMRKQGLHKGLRTEDVTSDRAGGHSAGLVGLMEAVAAAVAALCWGELVISLMALSALRASITHLTSGL